MTIVKLAIALLAAWLAASAAIAQEIQSRTIKVGIGLTADHPQGQSVQKFADLVKEKSGGKLNVRLFAGGAVGNDVTMISALQGGTLEMTVPDTSTLVGIAGLKDFGLINLPFLFNKSEEVYAVLEQRVVDGQENPLATILASKFYEVQKNAVLSNHIYSVWAFLMSKRFFDRLSADEQKIIREAAAEAQSFERKTIRDFDAKALEELKSKGMQVTTLPEAEIAKLREKTKPVWTKFTKEFGEAEASEMMAALA